MSKILVTGGTGTLGKPLVSFLKNQGNEVFTCNPFHMSDKNHIRCDISEFRETEKLFDHVTDVDFVYHLAAEFGRNNGEDYYEQLWKTNVIGTKNVIRMQERLKV